MIDYDKIFECWGNLVGIKGCEKEDNFETLINILPGVTTELGASMTSAERIKVTDVHSQLVQLSIRDIVSHVLGKLPESCASVTVLKSINQIGKVHSEVVEQEIDIKKHVIEIQRLCESPFLKIGLQNLQFRVFGTDTVVIEIDDGGIIVTKSIGVTDGEYVSYPIGLYSLSNVIKVKVDPCKGEIALGPNLCFCNHVNDCDHYVCNSCFASYQKVELCQGGEELTKSSNGLLLTVVCEYDLTDLFCSLRGVVSSAMLYRLGINYMYEIKNGSNMVPLLRDKEQATANLIAWSGGIDPDSDIRLPGLYWVALKNIINGISSAVQSLIMTEQRGLVVGSVGIA